MTQSYTPPHLKCRLHKSFQAYTIYIMRTFCLFLSDSCRKFLITHQNCSINMNFETYTHNVNCAQVKLGLNEFVLRLIFFLQRYLHIYTTVKQALHFIPKFLPNCILSICGKQQYHTKRTKYHYKYI
jgi:hypothetical protein